MRNCVGRHGVLVSNAASAPSLTVSMPHASVEPRFEQNRRMSASYSVSDSLCGTSITASCSKSSSVDMQSTQGTDTARPQTLAECQDFIRRLEADSVKQAHEVSCMNR